jgi:acyl dehydratase
MPQRIISGIDELKTLIGQEVSNSDWFEVSQQHINAFADATEDHQWIHVDPDRARTDSPFGSTIAHGFLTLSLLPHLAAQAVKIQGEFKMGINYGLLNGVEEVPGGFQITWSVTVESENGSKPSLVAEWLVRYYS